MSKSITVKSPWGDDVTLTTRWFIGWKVQTFQNSVGPENIEVPEDATTGQIIASFTGLKEGETVIRLTPDDGVLILNQEGTGVVFGSAPFTATNQSYMVETSDGRVSIIMATIPARETTPVDTDRFMFFATRAKVPSGNVYAAPGGKSYAGSRIVFHTPPYATRTFKFHWSGFASTEGGNSPRETVVPENDTIIDEAYMYANSSLHPLLFEGAASVTIASAALGAWCDDLTLPAPVAAEGEIAVITKWHVPTNTGNFIPVYRWQAHRGEKAWSATTLEELTALIDSDAPSTAEFSENYGRQQQLAVYGPDFMVAKGDWDGRPIALVPCDSIGLERQQYGPSADARGNLGWFRRWLDKPSGIGRIPHFPIGVPGAASFRDLTGSGTTIATRRWQVLDQVAAFNGGKLPFTVIINQMGQNDTTNPYNTWLTSRLTAFNNRVRDRYPGVKLIQVVPIGRVLGAQEFTAPENVGYANNNFWPAGDTDASGKWRLRNDIIAKTNNICDDFIDTLDGWQGSAGVAKPPMFTEMPYGTLTQAAGTDGTEAYTRYVVDDASGYLPEQQLAIYSPDGLTPLSNSAVITTIEGNTLNFYPSRAVVLPVGSRVYQYPVERNNNDGLHPQSILIKRMVDGLPGLPPVPQQYKTKLLS